MGVPARLFSVPSERSVAMLIAMFCRLAPRMPAAMIPAMKYWVKLHPVAEVVVQHRPEDDEQQHRQHQREDDRLALAEELLELHDRPGAVHRAPARAAATSSSVVMRRAPRSSAGTRPRGSAGRRPGPAPRRGSGRPAPARTPSASRSRAVRRAPSSVQLTSAGAVSRPPSSAGTATSTSRPRADDPDPVGQRLGLVEVVGGEQHRGAQLAQRADQRPELPAGLRVEAGRRLVEEEQGRAGRRCPAPRRAGAADHRTGPGRAPAPSRSARPARAPRRGPAGRGRDRPGRPPSRARSAGSRRSSTAARCPAAPSSARPPCAGSSPSTRTSPASRAR